MLRALGPVQFRWGLLDDHEHRVEWGLLQVRGLLLHHLICDYSQAPNIDFLIVVFPLLPQNPFGHAHPSLLALMSSGAIQAGVPTRLLLDLKS